MKRVYKIVFALVCVTALLSFIPWLYDIAFPTEDSDPFVAWSPVCDAFVVSETGENPRIYVVDSLCNEVPGNLTKTDRDSLVPQTYFNQLVAKGTLPDTIAGRAVDVPTLKHAQWVFTSMPRDINKVDAGVYPVMESRPKRVDLEDPKQVCIIDDEVRFYDMATNTVDTDRSQRFTKVFVDKGFAFPAIYANADITAKKGYDEGYLLIDSAHKLYHMKMQAGQPYLARIDLPDGEVPASAFILENPDMRQIGLVVTESGALYAVEKDGYRPVKLPVKDVDPKRQRIMIMKNLFNWVVRVSNADETRWTAIDSDTYALLGEYLDVKQESRAQKISRMIFPFRISFTSVDDSYARPRITDFSIAAFALWLSVICLVISICRWRRRRLERKQ